jgi:ribonucleoside-diphosphate reductase alpha chain
MILLRYLDDDRYKGIVQHLECYAERSGITPHVAEGSIGIIENRYLMRDAGGEIVENVQGMFIRAASTISMAEFEWTSDVTKVCSKAETFYEAMATMKFLPNSPVFKGAGLGINMAACYVIPLEDSRKSIFSALSEAADVQAFGGGAGFNFTPLRERGARINSTGGQSSGPVSFIKLFDMAIGEVITQGGGTRAGAQIAILMYNHPDINEFVVSKRAGGLTNFNISVGITEEFMQKVSSGEDFDVISPVNGVVGKRSARELFRLICENAHATGDPGLLFMDRIEAANPTPSLGKLGVNPCSEANLLSYESCVLGSINVSKFVEKPTPTACGKVDYDSMLRCIETAVRMLDNIVEINDYPVEKISKCTRGNRKIGLGVMGWADALSMLEIPYDSDLAITQANEIMSFIQDKSHSESELLAKERGCFPNHNRATKPARKRRNASVTLIAPTGTISTIAGCSGGIEPHYLLAYKRKSLYKDGVPLIEAVHINSVLIDYLETNFSAGDRELIIEDLLKEGTMSNVRRDVMPAQDVVRWFPTAHDIDWTWHLRMQHVFQCYCDMSISKTINLRHDASVDDVSDIFMEAYRKGDIKGVTVYRDGCKQHQVLTKAVEESTSGTGNNKDVLAAKPETKTETVVKVPEVLGATRYRQETPVGRLYITVSELDGKPFETFLNIGKAGADITAIAEGYGRLISLMLRKGIKVEDIIDQLSGIGGGVSVGFGPARIKSLPDGIAAVLRRHVDSNSVGPDTADSPQKGNNGCGDICLECGNIMVHCENCTKCTNCGYSRC